MIFLVACLERVLKGPGSLEQVFLRSHVRCAQQDVGLHIRHRLERNQLVGSAALTARFVIQRWKLGFKDRSNGPALGDQHLEIAHGLPQSLLLSLGVEQMRSEDFVVFRIWPSWMPAVNSGHDLAIRI